MRSKVLLAAFLLGVSFCFVPALGYGEKPEETLRESKPSLMEHYLLRARINYIMENPTNFLNVEFSYDPHGGWGQPVLPETIDTKGKICVVVTDNRDAFTYKSGTALLKEFKKALEAIYSSELVVWVIGLDTELVAVFRSKNEIPLGYFYQGEHHLVTPPEIKKEQKRALPEITVYITKTGKKYHRWGCRYLRKSCIPISLTEAKRRGYTPCKVCKPPP